MVGYLVLLTGAAMSFNIMRCNNLVFHILCSLLILGVGEMQPCTSTTTFKRNGPCQHPERLASSVQPKLTSSAPVAVTCVNDRQML